MAKTSKKSQKSSTPNPSSSSSASNTNPSNTTVSTLTSTTTTKAKKPRKTVPRDSPPQRSSSYRGVTRHRWTGRYEAHLWDKNCWNKSQNKKGRQGLIIFLLNLLRILFLNSGKKMGVLINFEFFVHININIDDGGSDGIKLETAVYLGAYDDEEAAAKAYDLAALKYWGQETILNFPPSNYEEETKEMEDQSKEEYIGSLRRKSSGFSRGVSKYRGVARHHHNGRWEARIGRVFGNKYLYLGTYATQEEAAQAYDMAAIEYRGLNAVTNFDLSRYIKWLRPNSDPNNPNPNPNPNLNTPHPRCQIPKPKQELECDVSAHQQTSSGSDMSAHPPRSAGGSSTSSALEILLQSSKYKEMMEKSSVDCLFTSPESGPSHRSFPDDIQTTFYDCQDSGSYTESEDTFFSLNSIVNPNFYGELDDG